MKSTKIEMSTIIKQIGKLAESMYEEWEQYDNTRDAVRSLVRADKRIATEEKMIVVSLIHQLLVSQDEEALENINCMLDVTEETVAYNAKEIRKIKAEEAAQKEYDRVMKQIVKKVTNTILETN